MLLTVDNFEYKGCSIEADIDRETFVITHNFESRNVCEYIDISISLID